MALSKREHDPNVCGLSPETDCDACRERFREMYERDGRTTARLDISAITAQLEKTTGLRRDQIADLMWMEIEPQLDAKIEQAVQERLAKELERARIVLASEGGF